jgi:hypothetical protein
MRQEIQNCITSIYEAIENYNTCREFSEIRYWFLRSTLGQNDNFLSCISNIDKQKKLVIRNLNQLSESVDDLEILINQSKNLVQLERNKDKQFAKHYEKYHTKLNGVVYETKV